MLKNHVNEKVAEVSTDFDEMRETIKAMKQQLQSAKVAIATSTPTIVDSSKRHRFIMPGYNHKLDMADPIQSAKYFKKYVPALDTLVEQISGTIMHTCDDGVNVIPIAKTPTKIRDYVVNCLTKATNSGKYMPFLDSTTPADIGATIDLNVSRKMPLRSNPGADSTLIGTSSALSFTERNFGISLDNIEAEDARNVDAVIVNYVNPNNNCNPKHLESLADQLGAERWLHTISNPKRKDIAKGQPALYSFNSIFYVPRSDAALRKLLTPTLFMQAMQHRIGAQSLIVSNTKLASWTHKNDFNFGGCVLRFITRLADTLLQGYLMPALNTVDIITPEKIITYDDYKIMLDICCSSLRMTRQLITVREELIDMFVIQAAVLDKYKLPVRGTLVRLCCEWLAICIKEDIPWTSKCVAKFESICMLRIAGSNPMKYWESYRQQHIDLMGDKLIDRNTNALKFVNLLPKISADGYGAAPNNNIPSVALAAPDDVVVPDIPDPEQNVNRKRKRSNVLKPNWALRSKGNRQNNAMSRGWWPAYVKEIAPKLPDSVKLDCQCSNDNCTNCLIVRLIQDVNHLAFMANGVRDVHQLITRAPGRKSGVAFTASLRGQCLVSIPISSKTFSEKRWKYVTTHHHHCQLRTHRKAKYTPAISKQLHVYPPALLPDVPSPDATFEQRKRWLRECTLSQPLFEPGACGVDESTSSDLCDLYRICNNPDYWSPQFMPATKAFRNLEFANELAKQFDINSDHVLATMKYGDCPGWIGCPNNDMIFVQQPIPKTIEELSAIVGGFHKSLFGKPGQPDTSIMHDISTVPLSMMHAGTFPILKSTDIIEGVPKNIYQCIYDCSNTTRNIVIKEDMYSVQMHPTNTGNLDFEFHLKVKFPKSSQKTRETTSLPINKLQINKLMFNVSTVDYTSLLALRKYLARWPDARLSWIDLSDWATNDLTRVVVGANVLRRFCGPGKKCI